MQCPQRQGMPAKPPQGLLLGVQDFSFAGIAAAKLKRTVRIIKCLNIIFLMGMERM